jgi:hypothetical protein
MKRMMISLLALSGLLLSGLVQAEGSVARAIVTTGVAEREPVNDLERVLAGNEKVIFFTELRNMEGQTVKHRWSHGEQTLAEVEFQVGGPRWRVWSSKNLMPEWAGEWKAEVVDGEGNVVAEKSFTVAADSSAVVPAGETPMGVTAPAEETPMADPAGAAGEMAMPAATPAE